MEPIGSYPNYAHFSKVRVGIGPWIVLQKIRSTAVVAQKGKFLQLSCYASKFLKQPKLGTGFSA